MENFDALKAAILRYMDQSDTKIQKEALEIELLIWTTRFLYQAKSRKYQGVFEVKSRVKTWQVRGIWSQQLEH